MSITFVRLIELLVLPPGGPLLLLLLGILIAGGWRFLGMAFITLGTAALYLACSPAVSHALVDFMQTRYPPFNDLPGTADAIVVLGAHGEPGGDAYNGGDMNMGMSLERARYAAKLHRETGLPVVAAGSADDGGGATGQAGWVKRFLSDEFGIRVAWENEGGRNTREIAASTATSLGQKGIGRVLLVTHAYHMPRAIWSFENEGVEVVAAPVGFIRPGVLDEGLFAWVPQASALLVTRLAMHEWLGLHYYRWRYG
ncbi:MAG: YdcF family protein [Pseudomonadota bacterium]|nr:YdcF family protein [Pseudomonadota bacterium]